MKTISMPLLTWEGLLTFNYPIEKLVLSKIIVMESDFQLRP